jgi:polyphosphate glucokinase
MKILMIDVTGTHVKIMVAGREKEREVPSDPGMTAKQVGFGFGGAFGRPVKVMSDAGMQALGSHQDGGKLFGAGNRLGAGSDCRQCASADGIGTSALQGRANIEYHVWAPGLKRLGKERREREVHDVVACLKAALDPDCVVLGGGNARELKRLPPGCRMGDNSNAFLTGFRLWEEQG